MIARLPCFAVLAALLFTACDPHTHSDDAGGHGHAHGQAEAHDDDAERGPHGGRLLRDGDFALELQIFEDGVAPEYHVYLYRDDAPLPPTAAAVEVALTRLDGQVDRFAFTPRGDALIGDGVVGEPHSFVVSVTARENGEVHTWQYDSFEGRTTIPADIARDAGVRTAAAGPATIAETVTLAGRIVPNSEYVRRVGARYPGTITDVAKSIGDPVARGERLATVESNESLKAYALSSPIDGVVVERHANPGEQASDEPLFVVADYSRLWAELALFPRDLTRVAVGQQVSLHGVDGQIQGNGRIVRIAPAEGEAHGSLSGIYTARLELDNPDGRWQPGLFVDARVQVGETPVPLAVRRSALQAFRDFAVVFERIGDNYEARMLDLGRRDETHVEVLSGLDEDAHYVVDNSYLIKADIEKSGASHDH